MAQDAWGTVTDGFAKGPDLVMFTERGDAVTCSALWTSERGVEVTAAVGDDVMTRAETMALAAMLQRLAVLPGPGGDVR